MTPTEARALELRLSHQRLDAEWPLDSELIDALRSLADQVESLEGQALSSVEREQYFSMKKDAERYRWLRDSGTAVNVWTDEYGTHWSISVRDWNIERTHLDEAIDRAREAT